MAESYRIEVNDYSEEVLKAMRSQVLVALKAIGNEAEGYAKDECPVDTGRLKNSIANKVVDDDYEVQVGTNVEYAAKQEFGDYHHKVGKKHYLRDSIANHGDHYKAILKAALED